MNLNLSTNTEMPSSLIREQKAGNKELMLLEEKRKRRLVIAKTAARYMEIGAK